MKNLNLSAQLYTLRDFTKTKGDFKKTLLKLKEIGYKSFQYSGVGFNDSNYVKECLDETGLILSATHTSPDRLNNNLEEVIAEHKLWSCEFVGIGMMPEEYRNSEANVTKFAKHFSVIGEKLKAEGLTLVYHNHNFEFQKYNNKLIMDILLEQSDERYFDFELDTYWVQAGGANPIDWIYKVNKRMKYIHFKDMGVKDFNPIFKPIGEGNLDWNGIIEACRKTQVQWCAIEQDICESSPFEALKISYDNLYNKYNF